MSTMYVGIDVSKDELEVSGIPGKKTSYSNTKRGIRSLLQKVAKLGDAYVVCEATGGYERALVRGCHQSGILISIVDPKRVRKFAFALGILEKNDQIDAKIIRRFAEVVTLRSVSVPSPARTALVELVKARDLIQRSKIKLQTQLRGFQDQGVIRMLRRSLRLLNNQLDSLNQRIREVISEDPELSQIDQCLCSIKGIGPTISAIMIATLPELGKVNRRQIAKLAGLAPICHDSGTSIGRRYIRGGRQMPRNALYMAAVVVMQHCSYYRPKYEAMIARGKPGKVAITAIARCLLVRANSLLRTVS